MESPTVFFLTPNGRYLPFVDICTTSEWSPAVDISMLLRSLAAILGTESKPSAGREQLGSAAVPAERLRRLAKESLGYNDANYQLQFVATLRDEMNTAIAEGVARAADRASGSGSSKASSPRNAPPPQARRPGPSLPPSAAAARSNNDDDD
jgi:hypothetical protein